MRIGAIQSNYMPWRGYFDFIDEVDLFVIHDDLQYTKNDWRNRNRIKTDVGTPWLTVPVHYRHTAQLIQDTAIDYGQPWAAKHVNLLRQWYGRAPHFARYADELFDLLRQPHPSLSALNVSLIKWGMAQLGIRTPLRFSSEFGLTGTKTARLVQLMERAGGRIYLSGPAAKSYLEPELFRSRGFGVEYKTYAYAPYPQGPGEFQGAVSIVDLLFNTGPEARRHLKSHLPAVVEVPCP